MTYRITQVPDTPPRRAPAPGSIESIPEPRLIDRRALVGFVAIATSALLALFAWHAYASPDQALAEGEAVTSSPTQTSPSALWVNSDSIGSHVYINGSISGTTPFWADSISTGIYDIVVDHNGYIMLDTTTIVNSGSIVGIDISSESSSYTIAEQTDDPSAHSRLGSIRVASSPAQSSVTLNGRRVGTTPFYRKDLPAGRHTLTLSKDGYVSVTRWIVVQPGVEIDAVIDLRPVETNRSTPPDDVAHGTVEIRVRPWGTILIDGVIRQRDADVLYRTTLTSGNHSIRTIHPTLGSAERTVNIQEGRVAYVEFNLVESAAPTVHPLPPAPVALPSPSVSRALESSEVPPVLIGGLAGLQSRVDYPEFAHRAGIEGQVLVQFVVDERGTVSEPVVLESPSDLLSTAALRAIRDSRFTPGRQNGAIVKVRMTLPVTFRMR